MSERKGGREAGRPAIETSHPEDGAKWMNARVGTDTPVLSIRFEVGGYL